MQGSPSKVTASAVTLHNDNQAPGDPETDGQGSRIEGEVGGRGVVVSFSGSGMSAELPLVEGELDERSSPQGLQGTRVVSSGESSLTDVQDLRNDHCSPGVHLQAEAKLARLYVRREEYYANLRKFAHADGNVTPALKEILRSLVSLRDTICEIGREKSAGSLVISPEENKLALELGADVLRESRFIADMNRSGGELPPGMTLGEILGYCRVGFCFEEAIQLHTAGLSPTGAKFECGENSTYRQIVDVSEVHLSQSQAVSLRIAGVTPALAIAAINEGWGVDALLQFKKIGFDFRDAQRFVAFYGNDRETAFSEAQSLTKKGLSGWEALEWKQRGLSSTNWAEWVAAGLTVDDFYDVILNKGAIRNIKDFEAALAIVKQGWFLKDYLLSINTGVSVADLANKLQLTADERAVLKSSNLGIEDAMAYRQRNVPITEATTDRSLRGDAVLKSRKELRGAEYRTIEEVTLEDGRKLVFKSEEKETRENAAVFSGISDLASDKLPELWKRNVATYLVAKKLDSDLVPRTEVGVRGEKVGIFMEVAPGVAAKVRWERDVSSEPLGKKFKKLSSEFDQREELMEHVLADQNEPIESVRFGAKGEVYATYFRMLDVDPGDALLRKKLTELQLLDALMGQVDRNPGNYFLEFDEKGNIKGIKAIDNDLAGGAKIEDANGIYSKIGLHGFMGVQLPNVIDTAMQRVYESLTPGGLEEILRKLNFSDSEIKAAMLRLEGIKMHISKLNDDGRVIGVTEWGSDKATQLLADATKENSYWKRDFGSSSQPSLKHKRITYKEAERLVAAA